MWARSLRCSCIERGEHSSQRFVGFLYDRATTLRMAPKGRTQPMALAKEVQVAQPPRAAPPGTIAKLFKDIAAYGAGDLLLRAASFVTLPIYTRLFAAADYGKLSYVTTSVSLIASVIALGGESAYARYYFEARTEPERQEITSSWLVFLAAWTIAVSLMLLPVSGFAARRSFGDAGDASLFVLAVIGVPVTLVSSFLGQALRNQFRAKLFAVLNALTTGLGILFSLWAVLGLHLGLRGMLGGTLAAGVVVLPIRVWTARDLLRPRFSLAWCRKLLRYGAPLVPMSIAYWVFGTSDRILLGSLSTLDQVGYYSVASSLTSLLGLAYGALGQAWSPHAVRLYEEDAAAASRTFGRMLTYILALFGLASVGMTAFAREGLHLVATAKFSPAAAAVGPLTIGFMAYASTQITALSISLMKRTGYLALYSWIAAVINVVLNLPLMPRWGMIAASWTTALAYVFLTIAYAITGQRLWPIQYEKRNTVVISSVTFVLILVLPLADALRAPEPVVIAVKTAGCVVYLLAMRVIGVLDPRAFSRLIPQRSPVENAGASTTTPE